MGTSADCVTAIPPRVGPFTVWPNEYPFGQSQFCPVCQVASGVTRSTENKGNGGGVHGLDGVQNGGRHATALSRSEIRPAAGGSVVTESVFAVLKAQPERMPSMAKDGKMVQGRMCRSSLKSACSF